MLTVLGVINRTMQRRPILEDAGGGPNLERRPAHRRDPRLPPRLRQGPVAAALQPPGARARLRGRAQHRERRLRALAGALHAGGDRLAEEPGLRHRRPPLRDVRRQADARRRQPQLVRRADVRRVQPRPVLLPLPAHLARGLRDLRPDPQHRRRGRQGHLAPGGPPARARASAAASSAASSSPTPCSRCCSASRSAPISSKAAPPSAAGASRSTPPSG